MMIIIVSNSNIDFKMSLLMYMYVIDNKLYSILFYSILFQSKLVATYQKGQ